MRASPFRDRSRRRRRSVFSRTSSCIACTGCFVFDVPTSRAAASPRRSVSTGLLKNLISSSILPFVVVGSSSSRAALHASANVLFPLASMHARDGSADPTRRSRCEARVRFPQLRSGESGWRTGDVMSNSQRVCTWCKNYNQKSL